jgi:4-hydroxyphenylacetate 3-monooxygenase
LIGTEFAGRHEQYEKFYGGASFWLQNMARTYDFAAAEMVDRALALSQEADRCRPHFSRVTMTSERKPHSAT